jgi:hypothetical protein
VWCIVWWGESICDQIWQFVLVLRYEEVVCITLVSEGFWGVYWGLCVDEGAAYAGERFVLVFR